MVFGLGKKNPGDGSEGGGPGAGAVASEEVRASIRKTRSRASRVAEEAALDAQAAELDQLYEGENWEEVGAIWFDTRFATTGWEEFRLTQSEKARLGVSLAATMRLLIKLDPRYAALLVFSINFGTLVAKKEMKYRMERKRAEEKAGTNGG